MLAVSDFDSGIKLHRTIWLDEMEFHDNFKGTTPTRRNSRKNAKDFKISESGQNTVRVIVGIDDYDNMVTIVTPDCGKILLPETAYELLNDKVEPGSTLITDYTDGYNVLTMKLSLKHTQYKSADKSYEAPEQMMPVNNLCSDITSFLERYHGIATKYLQNYLDYFRFSKYLKYRYTGDHNILLQYFDQIIKSRKILRLKDIAKLKF